MAPLAAFRAANLDFNPALTNLRFALDKRPDGSYVVRISSAGPVNEPYLDLMVELTWATGRVIREYTVLLDPPSLRADAPVVSPTVPPVATAPSVTPPAARPSAAPTSSPGLATTPPGTSAASTRTAPASRTSTPSSTPSTSTPSEGSYVVKSGDTLGAIAGRNKPASVSLDQMLVALLRANPDAFVGKNMNRLKAGATLTIPSESDAGGLAQRDARREVVAQSSDFAQYRSRLAQAAGSAPVAATAPPAAAGSGRVTAQVQDKSAPVAPKGDQLKIARAEQKSSAATAAAAKADEAAAKARAIREEQERAAQLKKTNEAIQKALQVQSKTGAAAQAQAQKGSPATTATPPAAVTSPQVAVAPPAPMPTPAPTPPAVSPGVTTPAPTPVAPVTPPGVPPTTPTPIDGSKSAPVAAVSPTPAPAVTPAPAPVVTPAPAPVKKAAPPPPPREEPSFFAELLGNTTIMLGLLLIVALLAALFGWSWYRKRRAESVDRFKETGEGTQANSLFGATGGQSVDTGTSTFNSSFIPAASQLDSNEVDPVAEADVYIAYGREEQAEDILKEALRLQPDRHAVRVKLMEIYARRGDKSSFMAVAEELRDRTGATGEDWERGVKLGRTVDPAHAMFAGAVLSDAARGPTTGFRLDPNTNTRSRPSTLGGGATGGLDLGGLTGAGASVMSRDTNVNVPPLTQMVVDTRMSDSKMQFETKMPQDTKLSGPETTSAPTTQFRATLPGADAAQKNGAAGPAAASAAAADFGSLDFDLGPTKMGNLDIATRMPDLDASPSRAEPDVFAATTPQRAEPPAVSDMDFALPKEKYQPMQPTATGVSAIPDLDLNIPPPTRTPAGPSTRMPVPPSAMMEEALSRPTVIGVKTPAAVGSLPDEQAARLTANTDQATVPLIDFDLSAVSLDAATKRGETEPGSALAQQMATKLDLARGYIDLGVKDGARELLDEVMRDGTREQRQAAVDLIKQIES
ncbi:MAG TPA: FimV/HubP family polar landmark protein [Burkholderiaceae bacterium]|nr:FimV/HubP family polar landmark protein [Burkholderiaceae bacterium]